MRKFKRQFAAKIVL